jgi:hypothetical protein
MQAVIFVKMTLRRLAAGESPGAANIVRLSANKR